MGTTRGVRRLLGRQRVIHIPLEQQQPLSRLLTTRRHLSDVTAEQEGVSQSRCLQGVLHRNRLLSLRLRADRPGGWPVAVRRHRILYLDSKDLRWRLSAELACDRL